MGVAVGNLLRLTTCHIQSLNLPSIRISRVHRSQLTVLGTNFVLCMHDWGGKHCKHKLACKGSAKIDFRLSSISCKTPKEATSHHSTATTSLHNTLLICCIHNLMWSPSLMNSIILSKLDLFDQMIMLSVFHGSMVILFDSDELY